LELSFLPMTILLTIAPQRVLADLIVQPTTRVRAIVRDVLLVVGFALLTAAAAQIEIQLGFTPVPLTGQTFAVLLSGAVLGMRRGALSQLVYWMAGLTGLPFYSGGAGGWKSGTGATLGYLVGFIVAAGAIGYLAEKKQDRNFATSLPAMLLGSTLIYTCGAAWLTTYLNIGFATGETNAIALGVAPFLVGDVIKALLAAACTTGVWAAVNKRR
jgi:biotin transport system substrate-specific component